ncbi:carbamoyltransferase C-terminal domain-containing protein [Candidatus Pelagibacter sp.]|nr:carbamoyltransferase C-terminal domain-containing protein [Candidatus Pelagibacter sp.]
MIFLGINVSHGASASLMIDGEIILAYQEERFNKIKNFVGYPKKSIEECIKFVRDKNLKIDEAGFSTINNLPFVFKYPLDNFFSIKDWLDYYLNDFFSEKEKIEQSIKKFNKFKKRKKINQYLDFNKIKKKDYFVNYSLFRVIQKKFLEKQAKGLIKKISFIEHHNCHAHYAAFAADIKENKCAVISLDSEGDGINQTFWLFSKKKNKLVKINQSAECDLARIYRFVTLILKMKPNEHEYKVMGLAPYAKNEYSQIVYEKVFKDILKVKNCKIVHKKRPKNLFRFLYENTKEFRFDNIAGAVQILIEKISSELFIQINKKYKINSFSISGGVSMNIKMNKNLASLPFVKKIYVAPTGTDESLAIGACYYLNKKYRTNKILKNIYLGQYLSNQKLTIETLIKKLNNIKKFTVKKNITHRQIAKLLKKGEIIAVARDKEEFGARALGNRSILANPSSNGIVQKINEQIKNRDFWMPFALTILNEKHQDLIINKKLLDCNFMTIGFDTKLKNYHKIKNGTHSYDKTVRPQILRKEYNENFHNIINEFNKITNIPALLNTSLNLHGMPISSKLDDVIYTFINSGLKYLYLDDNFLVIKNRN